MTTTLSVSAPENAETTLDIPQYLRADVDKCLARIPEPLREQGRTFLAKTIAYFWVEHFPRWLLYSDITSIEEFFIPLSNQLTVYHRTHSRPELSKVFDMPSDWWFTFNKAINQHKVAWVMSSLKGLVVSIRTRFTWAWLSS